MPDPISAQVDANPTPTPVTTPEPSPTPSSVSAAPSPEMGGGGASSPGAATPTPASIAPAQPSWLSQLRDKGVDLGADEVGAITRLQEMHQNYQRVAPIAPYVQAYMQHAPQFSKYLADQQRAQQQPAQTPDSQPFYAKYFNPPEFNPAWDRMVTKDAQGNLVPVQGAPPDVVPKYLAYQQFRQEQAEKFLNNPHEYMKDTITHLAREEAQKIVREQFGQKDTQSTVQSFLQDNSSWLHERDGQGNVQMVSQFNPSTGQYQQAPKLSQWGKAFAEYVKQEADYQARTGQQQDIARQRDVAMAYVQRDFATWKLQHGQSGSTGTPVAQAPAAPVDPQQAANARFLQQNNPAAGVVPMGGNSVPAPGGPVKRSNFTDMLKTNFKKAGITDEVLQNSN